MDLIVDGGCPFELKVVGTLSNNHRGQLIQYLMLTGLTHGKLINFGNEKLEHEFVNCHETIQQRRSFEVHKTDWHAASDSCRQLERIATGLLHDWGTGLPPSVYTEAVIALLGGREAVSGFVETVWEGQVTGRQPVNLLNKNTSLKITTMRTNLSSYETHLQRFLRSTKLTAIQWVNIESGKVTFKTLRK